MRQKFFYKDASPALAPGKQIAHGGIVTDKILDVVSGIVIHPNERRVLICKRVGGKALGNMWEFPGGKVNTGESLQAAISRELHEELGIEVKCAQEINVQYLTQNGGQKVRITTYAILQYDGEVQQDHSSHSQHLWIVNLEKFAPRVRSMDKFRPNWFDLFNSLFKGYVIHKVT